jgi:Protein of unknown function (DUF664)
MSEDSRNHPPPVGDERTMLLAFLEMQRQTVIWKAEGLSDLASRQTVPPSSMHMLGLVKHLAYVERSWFQRGVAGREIIVPWTEADPDADWRAEETETIAGIIEFYKQEIAVSNAIIAERDFDFTFKRREDDLSLRWVILHMIEETARHAGHADLIREVIDGVTGE